MADMMNEMDGARLAHDMWFGGRLRQQGGIAAIGHSARAAYAESALAGYELGVDTAELTHERESAIALAHEIYVHIADHPEMLADEADTLGDLAGVLERASERQWSSIVCEQPSGYRAVLTAMADEALALASVRSFR